jgi:hypothetical protein
MEQNMVQQIKNGGRIVYNDGRVGHQGVEGTVLAVDEKGMVVQFDDRADTTYIVFSQRRWMDFLTVVRGDELRPG